MFVAKQELTKVPFHLITEALAEASQAVEQELVTDAKERYDEFIAGKYAEYSDTHEAPYEGNFTDDYIFHEVSEDTLINAKRKAKQEAFKEIVLKLGLKAKASWLLPQVTAYIAKMPLPRNDKGLIDPKSFRTENFGKDDWHKGLWSYCLSFQRGLIVGSQTAEEGKNYSAIVPLLMMPAKKFNHVPYSDWDREGLHHIVDENLLQAMLCTDKIEATTEEILKWRDNGLTIKTGASAGEKRSPMSYHKLYNITDTPLHSIGWLASVMVTQIWAAHPINRTNLMVLDYLDWDKMPTPLIDHEILPTKKSTKLVVKDDLDW